MARPYGSFKGKKKELRWWADGNYQYRLNLKTTWRPVWKEQLAPSLAWLPTRIPKITLTLSLPGHFQSQKSLFLNDDTWPAGRNCPSLPESQAAAAAVAAPANQGNTLHQSINQVEQGFNLVNLPLPLSSGALIWRLAELRTRWWWWFWKVSV